MLDLGIFKTTLSAGSKTTLTSTLSVGSTAIKGISVGSNGTFKGSLSIGGATSFTSTLSVGSSLAVKGYLSVGGATTLSIH